MKKILLGICITILLLALAGCQGEEEALPAVQVQEVPFTFEVPGSFIKDAEKSGKNRAYYKSDVFEEGSYVLYESSRETINSKWLKEEEIEEQTNRELKEKYLTNTKSEVLDFSRESKEDGQVVRYTLTYNLYSAIVTHRHLYYEKNGVLHHLEYYDIEEEGYHSAFESYYKNIRIE